MTAGILVNRASATSTSTGTGAATPGAAIPPYNTWSGAGAVSGLYYDYLIEDGNAWEVGTGLWNGTTLTRPGPGVDFNFESSTGSLLGLSGAGIKISCVEHKFSRPLVTYDPVILAESSLTHYWKLNEAAGATSFADSKGAVALTITSDTAGNIVAGEKGTVPDGQTAVLFQGIPASKTNGIINFPTGSSLIPASGDYSLEFVLGFEGQYYAILGVVFNMGSSGGSNGGDLLMYIRNDAYAQKDRMWMSVSNGVDNWQPNNPMRLGRGTHLVVTADATANKMTIWTNGIKNATQFTGIARQTAAGGFGTYMPTRDGNIYPYAGKLSKFAIYNAVLTKAQIQSHADAAGLM